ncbi:helix-turn-helix domain-containing protein [Pirellulaceae bacterium SH467]|jgi:transcriptional regulator with XRE-family HTH domain
MSQQPTIQLNPELFRAARLERGLTQRELANLAGYSERVIRKAEMGGRIRYQLACDIAEALSSPSRPVTLEQLCFSNLAVAKRWMQTFDEHGVNMMQHLGPFLSKDVVFVCEGSKETFPFNGTWHGLEGHQGWLDAFFGIFERVQGISPVYLQGDGIVSARWNELVKIAGVLCPPVRVCLNFHFENQLIVRIEDDYNIEAGAEYKERILNELRREDSPSSSPSDRGVEDSQQASIPLYPPRQAGSLRGAKA